MPNLSLAQQNYQNALAALKDAGGTPLPPLPGLPTPTVPSLASITSAAQSALSTVAVPAAQVPSSGVTPPTLPTLNAPSVLKVEPVTVSIGNPVTGSSSGVSSSGVSSSGVSSPGVPSPGVPSSTPPVSPPTSAPNTSTTPQWQSIESYPNEAPSATAPVGSYAWAAYLALDGGVPPSFLVSVADVHVGEPIVYSWSGTNMNNTGDSFTVSFNGQSITIQNGPSPMENGIGLWEIQSLNSGSSTGGLPWLAQPFSPVSAVPGGAASATGTVSYQATNRNGSVSGVATFNIYASPTATTPPSAPAVTTTSTSTATPVVASQPATVTTTPQTTAAGVAQATAALNAYLAINPSPSPQDLANAIKSAGGLTADAAQALATAYGVTPAQITATYNQLTGG